MPKARTKKSKYLFMCVRIAVVVCGIIWAISWLGRENRWKNLVEIFRQLNLWVFAAALGIFTLGQIIVALRWWLLLRTQSIFINFSAAVRLHFLGLFYNNFMPGSVGGDLIRAWYVTKHTEKGFEAALSVFVDRVIGFLSTLIIAVFFYLLFLRAEGALIIFSSENEDSFYYFIGQYKWHFLGAIVAVCCAFILFLLHKKGRQTLQKICSSAWFHSVRLIVKFKDAIIFYCKKPLTILVVFALTVFLQLFTIMGFWLVGLDMGINLSIKYYFVFFTLSWALGAIPISIGGAVVVEVLLASLFIKFGGVAQEPASALALSQRAVWMLASLPGAVIHLVGAHLPKDFSIDYNEPFD